jgi:hypothetical protein
VPTNALAANPPPASSAARERVKSTAPAAASEPTISAMYIQNM